MSPIELPDAMVPHLVRPGDRLNPSGKQEPRVARLRRFEIKKALLHELEEQCDIPGLEHLTWFRAGLLAMLRLHVAGVPWATKQLYNYAFGRVPLNIDASLTMTKPALDLSELTLEELSARAEVLAATVRQVALSERHREVRREPDETVDGETLPAGSREPDEGTVDADGSIPTGTEPETGITLSSLSQNETDGPPDAPVQHIEGESQ
jgi:hypothetical protein